VEGKVNIKMGIVWVCVVLFMAIQAMGVSPTTTASPMDQISGTFLISAIVTLSLFMEIAVFVLFCSHYRL
jgi:heme/copper-type cytochrome/quinol oxidase subunit 2